MGKISDLRERYDAVRQDGALAEEVRLDQEEWASGEIAVRYFGPNANELDALCLMASYERNMSYALWAQVQGAVDAGRSWNEIAAALGVSRQAATKRFD